MKRSVENWYYNLKLNENWRSYATLKLSYLKIMEVAISTRLEPAVDLLWVWLVPVWLEPVLYKKLCGHLQIILLRDFCRKFDSKFLYL